MLYEKRRIARKYKAESRDGLMQNLLNDLTRLLEQDNRLVAESKLLKNKIVELALALDPGLIKQLLKHDAISKHFFVEVEGVLVFDKIKFQRFVSNKQFLPDSYTAFKNKIGLTANGKYLTESKEVVLSWPYKDCVLEGGQDKEDAKRNEVFWNETLAPDQIDRLLSPKALTGFKRYDKDGAHTVTELSLNDNLIIKGNNLLALHTLMKVYSGRVKLIYIDPPYNTEEDSFLYNDSFNHSTWLTFIKNRLSAAKDLLSDNGVIFVQISDIEHAYLKVLLDEIFTRECFEASICVKMSHLSGPKMAHKNKKIPKIKENILVYSKKSNSIKINPQYMPVTWNDAFNRYTSFIDFQGNPDNHENWKSISLNMALEESGIDLNDEQAVIDFKINNADKIFQTAINRSKNYPRTPHGKFLLVDEKYIINGREVIFANEKIAEIDGVLQPVSILGDIWTDIGINNVFQEGGEDIDLRFGKKPEMLLERIIALTTEPNDLVLDFFMGTATTCATAMKMKRRFIGVEQLDYIETKSKRRLINVIAGDETGISKKYNWTGGGSFVFCKLVNVNQNYIDLIQASKTTVDLDAIWQVMQERAFLSYKLDPKAFDASKSEFASLAFADQQRFLIEMLDKNLLYVPYSEIDDASYAVSEEDKKLNRLFFDL